MSGRESLFPSLPTEHKYELDSGWLLNRETGDMTEYIGVRILWRFEGERKWRKQVLIPDAEQGQTVGSLIDQVPEIVASLAHKVSSEVSA